MEADLIERLRRAIKTTEYKYFGDYEMSDDQREAVDTLVEFAQKYLQAADTITTLQARVEKLTEALRPFADCCEWISEDEDDEEWAKFRLLIKDYRRARAALTDAKTKDSPHGS